MKLLQAIITSTLLLVVLLLPGIASAGNALQCSDRLCLMQLVDDYFAAMLAHDPSLLPFAEDVVFVENLQRKSPGEGLWQTATSVPEEFKIYVPDPGVGQVGFIGVLDEDKRRLMIALRLKVEEGQITEVEHVVARTLRGNDLRNLQAPRPAFFETIPVTERMNPGELESIAASAYQALLKADSSLSNFSDDCLRRENGIQTTGNPLPVTGAARTAFTYFGTLGCGEQLDTGIFGYIDAIENIRIDAIDPETGLVFGLSHFRMGMETNIIPIKGVEGITSRTINFDPFDLAAAHVYKIHHGQIYEIEAIGATVPYMSATGWE